MKQKIIIGIIAVVLLSAAYFSFLMLRISSSEIALAELNKSFEKEKNCHEKCNLWRQDRENVIIHSLKENEKRIASAMLNYWKNKEISQEFKQEIVKLNYLAYGKNNPPQYLKDYLNKNDSQPELIKEIISIFSPDLPESDKLGFDLSDKYSVASSSVEKVAILKTMAALNNDSAIEGYFSLLNSESDPIIKLQLIKNISSIKDKTNYFNLAQLEMIRNLILDKNTSLIVRQNLVLLLGDYYLVFPVESSSVWREVYANNSLDNISRLFSADNLNHLIKTNLALPEVNPEDWEAYYNK